MRAGPKVEGMRRQNPKLEGKICRWSGLLTQDDEDAQNKEDSGDCEAPDSQRLVVCGPRKGQGGKMGR